MNKIFLIGLIAIPMAVFSQNYTDSPYSKFIIGDQINTGFSYNRSLGGSSIALRPTNQINYLNPASYTSQDTLSFLFQAGAAQRFNKITSDLDQDQTRNMNIEYIVLGIPVSRWWKFSAGIVPYSRMEYYFEQQPEVYPDTFRIDYKGNGGINEFYFGSAFKIGKYISVGVNAGYLFGSLNKSRTELEINGNPVSTITDISGQMKASDFYFKLGLQAFKTFADKHRVIIGMTYDPKINIRYKLDFLTNRNYGILDDTMYYRNDSSINFVMPPKYAFGLTYVYNDKLLVTGEYSFQNFTKGSLLGSNNQLNDYKSLRFGVEYIPAPLTSRNRADYYKRMHYRAGAHYTNTYLKLGNTEITDYGFSAGLGFPWRNAKKVYTYTTFNIAYEYGVRGSTNNGLVRENYHIITLGLTMHDFWFFKPKYD